jgi:FdhD protein
MGRVTARRPIQRRSAEKTVSRPETVVVEEPLEIRVNGSPITVTMRTPGSDFKLAQGFLLTENVIVHRDDVEAIRYCSGTGPDGIGPDAGRFPAWRFDECLFTTGPRCRPGPRVDDAANERNNPGCR